MFDWLYRFLGSMLSFFESFTGGYAFALLLYALVFKIVFLPFSIKQQKNQIALAKLTPKIELIRAKYKGRTDQPTMQKQQQEIMELQQKEGYSPLSGCLPLLIQLPLIMLLYTVIQNPLSYIAKPTEPIEEYNKEYEMSDETLNNYYSDIIEDEEKIDMKDIILVVYKDISPLDEDVQKLTEVKKGTEINIIDKINDFIDDKDGLYSSNEGGALATKEQRIARIESLGLDVDSIPNFNFFGVNLAKTPSLKRENISVLAIIPFLVAAIQWLSMWLTRKINGSGAQTPQDAQTQASMKMMDIIFPAMTLWMAFSFSAMLGLYWMFQSILGLGQSFILAKAMPLPKFTEEELKEMRKAQKAAEKAQREAAKAQPKYRSLHYIDDDDYDVLPDAPTSNDNSKSKDLNGDVPEIKD